MPQQAKTNDVKSARRPKNRECRAGPAPSPNASALPVTDWRALFETIPAALYVTDADGRILYYNEPAVELWGYRPRIPDDQWCGSWKLFWPDGTPMAHAECPMAQAIKQRRPIRGQEGIAERPDGTRIPFMPLPTPLFDDAGEMIGALNLLVDITERKNAELRLEDLTRQLESQVVARTAEVRRRAEQLERLAIELLTAEQRERARLADALHNDHQHVLASALLKIRRLAMSMSAETQVDQAEQIDQLLCQAIDQTRMVTIDLSPPILTHGTLSQALVSLVSDITRVHELQIDADIEEGIASPSEAVGYLLYESARELLFNVKKHSGENRAQLTLRRRNGTIDLSVSDTGAGLGAGVQDAPRSNGTGFGLRSIMERIRVLGGNVDLEIPDAGGLRIRIAVPTGNGHDTEALEGSDGSATTHDASATRASHGATDRIRVLVVDDHHLVREGLVSIIREDDALKIVGVAADGAEAIAEVENLRPDVVLMDVNMPKLNGIDACRRIHREFPGVQVIGLSVNDDEATMNAMLAVGAISYITKDAPSGRLVQAIRTAHAQSAPSDSIPTAV